MRQYLSFLNIFFYRFYRVEKFGEIFAESK